jgi:glycosyltransferase involved in cell wall biosynthesis
VEDLISVIVTTYDRPDALQAVLAGLACQTDRGFEVVIADDGSSPATGDMVAAWRSGMGVSLHHVWHPHHGFRAAEIRNRAILASRGGYCVFLDGDCIPRSDFVAIHRKLAQPGWFVAGNRVLLSEAATKGTLRGGIRPHKWRAAEAVRQRLRGGVNRMSAMLKLPLGPMRKLHARQWRGARSCNLAVWRSDLDLVDGFDAIYNGWGREDSDLLIRLIHAGVRRKDGRFATGVFHLWHAEEDRSRVSANDALLRAVLQIKQTRARRGLSMMRKELGGNACTHGEDIRS